jgi:hypothetical protein
MHWVLLNLYQMGTRVRKVTFLESKARPVRRADRLSAISELIVYTMWYVNISQSYWTPRPVLEIALPRFTYSYFVLLLKSIYQFSIV